MKLKSEKSIVINKSASEIFDVLSDLNKWNIWSPWIHIEPRSKTNVTGPAKKVGQTQTWEGEVVGSGKMTFTELNEPTNLIIKLEFYKPWKSIAETFFNLKKITENKTEVTWTMISTLPFFMFFFKGYMKAYMESDFIRGLAMLKDYLETGNVFSKSNFIGEKNFEGFKAIGIKKTISMMDILKIAPQDFSNLDSLLKQGKLPTPKNVISIYPKHNIIKGSCDFIAAFTYDLNQEIKLPDGYEEFVFADHRGLLLEHYGPYKYLANAWSAIFAYSKAKKKIQSKNFAQYEIYKSMPGEVDDEEILTEIIMPVK